MSTSLLIVMRSSNGYSGPSGQSALTSQVLKFNSKWDAERAEKQLYEHYSESSLVIQVTLLEGTA